MHTLSMRAGMAPHARPSVRRPASESAAAASAGMAAQGFACRAVSPGIRRFKNSGHSAPAAGRLVIPGAARARRGWTGAARRRGVAARADDDDRIVYTGGAEEPDDDPFTDSVEETQEDIGDGLDDDDDDSDEDDATIVDKDDEQYEMDVVAVEEDGEAAAEDDTLVTGGAKGLRSTPTSKLVELVAVGDTEDFLDEELEELEELELEEEEEEEEEEGSMDAEYEELDPRVAVLSELLEASGLEIISGDGPDLMEIEVTGIADDSRKVKEGDLFVCKKGLSFDGHDYASQALDNGAVGVIVSEAVADVTEEDIVITVPDTNAALTALARSFYGDPSKQMTMVGVTGTNGKTTTAYLLRGMFEARKKITGLIGTIEYAVGDELLTEDGDIWEPEEEDITINLPCTWPGANLPYKGKYEAPHTTPGALQCQQIMACMVDQGAAACAVEVSSHALDQGRVDGVDFDVAVFTNLTRDHLDYHETFEAYREAKALLFRRLSDPGRQRAVINLDDPEAPFFIEAASAVPVVTYAVDNAEADVYPEEIHLSLFETELEIRTPAGNLQVVSAMLGRTNVYNILAAVAVGCAQGWPLEEIVAGIEGVEAVPGRFELIDEGQPFAVIVDYAHTPDALERLLDTVREIGARRIITVFGCGGDRDRGKRAIMGRIADEKSDVVYATSDNPRTEDPSSILDDIVEGFSDEVKNAFPRSRPKKWLTDIKNVKRHQRVRVLEYMSKIRRFVGDDRFYAIRAMIAMAEEGDAVVIAGKGHEDYQVHGTEKHWFDDRVECRDALSKVASLHESGIDTRNLPWRNLNLPSRGNS